MSWLWIIAGVALGLAAAAAAALVLAYKIALFLEDNL